MLDSCPLNHLGNLIKCWGWGRAHGQSEECYGWPKTGCPILVTQCLCALLELRTAVWGTAVLAVNSLTHSRGSVGALRRGTWVGAGHRLGAVEGESRLKHPRQAWTQKVTRLGLCDCVAAMKEIGAQRAQMRRESESWARDWWLGRFGGTFW